MEVVVAWSMEELGLERRSASLLMGGGCWALGLASAISPTVFAFCNNASSLYLLPVGGLLIALIAAWLIPRADRDSGFAALAGGGVLLSSIWTKLIRYVVPWLAVVL